MSKIQEADIEQHAIKRFEALGWEYVDPEVMESERGDLATVISENRFRTQLEIINGPLEDVVYKEIKKKIQVDTHAELVAENERIHELLTKGVTIDTQVDGVTRGKKYWLIDFETIHNNSFTVTQQFTVYGKNYTKRADLVLMVNGLPLVLAELKNISVDNALDRAYMQLQTYKETIPQLFAYNALLITSDGLQARIGSVTSTSERFMAWKSADGANEASRTISQIDTLITGVFTHATLCDLLQYFVVFEKEEREHANGEHFIASVKKIAAYHQYYAVNRAILSTVRAIQENTDTGVVEERPEKYGMVSTEVQKNGDKRIGVVWHTQGSGKSLSMVFYAAKAAHAFGNPTIVVLTDRNDLDDQLFDTFASCKQVLGQVPVQAESREHMKTLLKVQGGGIVFTTIHKFFPEKQSDSFEKLTDRRNVIVIADEAHRTQYGFAARMVERATGMHTTYGFAKYMRDALPNASFIGFTGTPVEKIDANTPAVFGNYIDIYDIAQAVDDGATVNIYYESRLAKVHLPEEKLEQIDEEVEVLAEGTEETMLHEAKLKWTQLEAVVGSTERLKSVAQDIVQHYEKRNEVIQGKAMIVCMSRRIAVALYDEIVKLRPELVTGDLRKGALKVVMTSSSSDETSWQKHKTNKAERKVLAERFKDPHDELRLVIVRDMWLTGFDAPCLHTMYIDKPMRGHTLMQAIARVNRVYADKPGGLIVDYIGIATQLKYALQTYTASGGRGEQTTDVDAAVKIFIEKLEIVQGLLSGFAYEGYFTMPISERLQVILNATEFVLQLHEGKKRFLTQMQGLLKIFTICVPDERVMHYNDEIALYATIAKYLKSLDEKTGEYVSSARIEHAIRQIVDKAISTDGVIDVFDIAGVSRPNLAVLSDEFLEEIRQLKTKNLAAEMLQKIINDQIKIRGKTNMVLSKKLSEMLRLTVQKYHNGLLTSVEVIEELIRLAKEIRESDKKGEELKLEPYELAFYYALAENDSAKEILQDEKLTLLAIRVCECVRANATIDWEIRDSVKAKMRILVKKILKEFGYPPDLQELATTTVLKQAELLAEELRAQKDGKDAHK